MDWISAPNGLQGYRQRFNGWANPISTDPRDYYCQPYLLEELGKFGNRLFTAIGCSRTVPAADGFSFQSLCTHFATHLRLAMRLATLEEQYRWLSQATDLFLTSLSLIGTTLAQRIYSSSPLDKAIEGPLITLSAEPITALREAEESLEAMTNQRVEWELYNNTSSSHAAAAIPDQLPLLSQRRIKGPARPRPLDAQKAKKPKLPQGALADSPRPTGLHSQARFWRGCALETEIHSSSPGKCGTSRLSPATSE